MTNKKGKIIEKGITLISLVVTIIILMLLAGITLTLVLGQNGIIGKAQQAKSLSQNAQNAEQEGLNSMYNELIGATKIASNLGGDILSTTDNIALKDDNGNIVTIPSGFKISSDSPTKQEQGVVIEDKDGNQFVWIPVSSIANYTRTDFGKQDGAYNNYSETIPSDEQTSVNKYHGYYIGRYEAGDKEATTNKVMRSSSVITDTVTIKNGQAPYNLVKINQAKTLAEGMKTAEGYNASTKLCSSYAWDTAINFIQKTVSNYGVSSPQGNYTDTTFMYKDITGTSQTKALNSRVVIPTGQTTPVDSIYDMGGNDYEWTTEACNYYVSWPCVYRGGYYALDYAGDSAGHRYCDDVGKYSDNLAFRVTLYM